MYGDAGPAGRRDAAGGQTRVVTAVVGMAGPAAHPCGHSMRASASALPTRRRWFAPGAGDGPRREKYGAEIVPVDSEHSGHLPVPRWASRKGPGAPSASHLLRRPVLRHDAGRSWKTSPKHDALQATPTGRWGAKITVDCATLMNKGLELIEAMRLYRLPLSQVDVRHSPAEHRPLPGGIL